MKKWLLAAAAALASVALLKSGMALAQGVSTPGEVTKIDKDSGKVTLKHSEIKSLDMPAMTMAYRVRDPKLLETVAVGDRVRFVAERVDGQYTVTSLSKGP
ncbi:MAG TPA: copper-binding protein [Rubrivivax sp.]|jgi:Cu/Ag efflux protein CusF|nr:copper-binding protein [Rubrivivax sp.]